ncbi:cyclic nucleotide-gated cation channel alpha-3-like, partial [Limulus polyphemus]|uniref:Cyclic nucleotide-gated cation channel alpha-3-like n=1 Tax=Limulus polyphemus TaxID=6850 RepID=A0ABM1C302_LIMPO
PGEGKHLTFSTPVAAMMVDGSPRRASGVQVEVVSKCNENLVESLKPSGSQEAAEGRKTTASPKEGSNTRNVTSRSRWLKLRTTVQLSGAITHSQKKPPLKREDSFLKRFSTRQFPDSVSGDGSASYNYDTQFERWKGLQCLRVLLHVINPDENLLFGWLWLLTGCVLYNAWTLIVRQAFPELHQAAASFWFTADGFSDLVYLIDIAVQFRTGYLEQGLMVVDAKKLALHYVRCRHFLMDLAALVPLDLLQLHVGTIPLLRFPRFSKVYRSYRFYYMVESRTIYPNLWRVVNLIHILLLLAHWFGCFYYMLSEFEGFQGEWVYPKPEGDYATLTRKYLGSVYWSTLTLTTIGDLATPASNLHYTFINLGMVFSVLLLVTPSLISAWCL